MSGEIVTQYGFGDGWGEDSGPPRPLGVVSSRYKFPPFSILDARKGEWQARKTELLGMGIKSEVGRDASLTYSIPLKSYDGDRMAEEYYSEEAQEKNTSIFDPVLCELVYLWFCPPGGMVLDPFAGGSVRGVMASYSGRRYFGVELRKEQVESNRTQMRTIARKFRRGSRFENEAEWRVGDAIDVVPNQAPEADAIFTCPPYGDLEVYSDHPRDLSNMTPNGFALAYRKIIRESVARLRENSFASIVVGDYRDGHFLTDFVGLTIEAFEDAGARLYNRAILSTMVGSGSMRANRQFAAGRKLVKTHQNLLVFAKGDPMRAAELCAEGDDE